MKGHRVKSSGLQGHCSSPEILGTSCVAIQNFSDFRIRQRVRWNSVNLPRQGAVPISKRVNISAMKRVDCHVRWDFKRLLIASCQLRSSFAKSYTELSVFKAFMVLGIQEDGRGK